MKCPVCNIETDSNICHVCGYDRSVDLEMNPSLSLIAEPGLSKMELLRRHGAASADAALLLPRLERLEADVQTMLAMLSAVADKLGVQSEKQAARKMPKKDTVPADKTVSEVGEKCAGIIVGDIVSFGRYPQSADGSKYEDLDWITIYTDDKYVVLISKYIIDSHYFCSHVSGSAKKAYYYSGSNSKSSNAAQEKSVDIWHKSDIRGWLNNEFVSVAFNIEEQASLAPVLLSDNGFELYFEETNPDKTDKVFLLNEADYERYYEVINKKACTYTPYAESLYYDYIGWWLNTAAAECANRFVPLNSGGDVSEKSCVHDNNCGVRPVICLSIKDIDIFSA